MTDARHSHGHHHHHHITAEGEKNLGKTFMIGIWLNVIYVLIEGGCGIMFDSMGLVSDAGHNLSDVASLIIALIAFKAARKKPTSKYTYGYRKATIDASVINAIILYIAVALILFESVKKLFEPSSVDGGAVAWVAGAGILVNGITAWLFMKESKHDLNVKGAFLHMAADTLVSVGVVISGIVISFTGWDLVDPIIGICIAIMIAVSSFSMLKDSIRLSLDGVPPGIDVNAVEKAISRTPGVNSFHHLHIWALSTTDTAMTVHVIVSSPEMTDKAIRGVRESMSRMGISHSTIEAETTDNECRC